VLKQIEILIEGSNPEADGPLTEAETQRVRAVLAAGEEVEAFVRGRVLRAGAGLWVLTPKRLLMLDMRGRGSTDRFALTELRALELQRGRYGHCVAVQAQGRRRSLFGADAELACTFTAALAQRSNAWPAGVPLPAPPAEG
jgi:hypothetical protein